MGTPNPPKSPIIFTTFPVVFPPLSHKNTDHIPLLVIHDIIHRKKEMDGITVRVLLPAIHRDQKREELESFLNRWQMSPSFIKSIKDRSKTSERNITRLFHRLRSGDYVFRQECFLFHCPDCRAIIPNSAVNFTEISETFYHIRYHTGNKSSPLVVATPYPETILGDTALAVHPDDQRYTGFFHSTVTVPVSGHHIPVIADKKVNRDKGTGIVHVSPQNHPFDFEMSIRHKLPVTNIIDLDGNMTDSVPRGMRGLPRKQCRTVILEQLEKNKRLEKEETGTHRRPLCHHCKKLLVPVISTQWFQKMVPQKKLTDTGKGLNFFPENLKKKYHSWIDTRKDWRISTPLKNSHPVPGTPETGPVSCFEPRFLDALHAYNSLRSTPENTSPSPIPLLAVGSDSNPVQLFRFLSTGIQLTGHLSFRDILHINRRGENDSQNIPGTLTAIDGTVTCQDTLRLAMITRKKSPRSSGKSPVPLKIHETFFKKLPGVCSYLQKSPPVTLQYRKEPSSMPVLEKWIRHSLNITARKINDQIENYQIPAAARTLIQFFLGEYHRWYFKFYQGTPHGPREKETATGTFLIMLRLLYPFLPDMSERLHRMLTGGSGSLRDRAFPSFSHHFVYPQAYGTIEKMKKLIGGIKKLRAVTRQVMPQNRHIILFNPDKRERMEMAECTGCISYFLPGSSITIESKRDRIPRGFRQDVFRWEIILPLTDQTHQEKTLENLSAELIELEREISRREENISRQPPGEGKRSEKKKLQKLFARRDGTQKRIKEIT